MSEENGDRTEGFGARLRSGVSKAGDTAKRVGGSTAAMRQASSPDGHPVLFGLLALIVVAVAVGLVLGFATVLGSKALGLGESNNSAVSGEQQSMFLPSPEPTETPDGPLVTLAPVPNASPDRDDVPTEEPSSDVPISLTVVQKEVPPMGQIDLQGTYSGGEGAILQVQLFENGEWRDFPVTASVSGETFFTFVQTGRTGENRFRVRDTDSQLDSNEVKVTVTGG